MSRKSGTPCHFPYPPPHSIRPSQSQTVSSTMLATVNVYYVIAGSPAPTTMFASFFIDNPTPFNGQPGLGDGYYNVPLKSCARSIFQRTYVVFPSHRSPSPSPAKTIYHLSERLRHR